jgi:hypothetical protein
MDANSKHSSQSVFQNPPGEGTGPTGHDGFRHFLIGSGAEDCAATPSHTTGRAVFRIRRLNAATVYTVAARSDGITNP